MDEKKVSQNSHSGLRQRWKKSKGFLATSGLGLKFLQKWRSRTWKKLFFVCKWILGLLKLHKITNFLTMEVQQFRFSLNFLYIMKKYDHILFLWESAEEGSKNILPQPHSSKFFWYLRCLVVKHFFHLWSKVSLGHPL